ncbi:MAG: antibiotic biosynthesis monooxygenase [Acidobacteria bacterium]|nr:antibiotic biosynthesis monooxygenase [Acidobacteriota bacterium]
MLRVIYDFRIRPECDAELDELVRLWFGSMSTFPGFISISLFQDRGDPGHYCSIGDWQDATSYQAFYESDAHRAVAEASRDLFDAEARHTFQLCYQITARDGGE